MGKEMQIHLKEKNGEGNITISIMLLRKITRKPQNISLFKLTMTPFMESRVLCSILDAKPGYQVVPHPKCRHFFLIKTNHFVLIRCLASVNTRKYFIKASQPFILCEHYKQTQE